MKNRQWDSTVFNDAEEAGNWWGNQIESKQPFPFYSVPSTPASCKIQQ